MTDTAERAAPASPASAAAGSGRRRGFLSRHRASLLIALGLVAAVAVAALTGGADTTTPMDPDNAGPAGTRAVARVLDDKGVDVVVARSADELESVPVGSDTSVVVVLPANLGEVTVERLLEHTDGAAHLIVLGADIGSAEALGAPVTPSNVDLGEGRDAGCVDPLFDGLTVEVDSAPVYEGGDCFPGDLGALVLRPRDGLLLFGAEQAFTNDQVLRADNAAVALRLLGQDRRLVWYVPSLGDLSAGESVSMTSLLPRWVFPGLWMAGLAVVAVVVWRGRRLGPLAAEPLPVVVRAVETTRSLGRLYRRAGDRAHAAAALRRAARTRCAERLRLGSRFDPAGLVREVARRTGRPETEVARLLDPPPGDPGPTTDRDLIILAQALAELDREVKGP
ncbi:DUF4350 domain-containing protein [Nocardioides sp.]|uniref:DUF4350 domain-containing protein n=1 Tax=Nocardioides sp. TaxID=35761 RepID=UPI001A267E5E|nr:DUF4350 domain-containing protein [Nocardioides sp.]MBJ7358130.1 DUF4350 domain-containing protein [Nocardioides sp.]